MKNRILLSIFMILSVCLLSSCGGRIKAAALKKSEELCSKNGGLSHIVINAQLSQNIASVVCNDNATFNGTLTGL